MWRAVITETIELATDSTFVRNLSLSAIVLMAGLCELAKLQNQTVGLAQQTPITNLSSSSSIRVVIVSD